MLGRRCTLLFKPWTFHTSMCNLCEPPNSYAEVLIGGEQVSHPQIHGHRLTVLGDDGVKYLGRLFEVDLSERCLREHLQNTPWGWVGAVGSCHMDGVMKCWASHLGRPERVFCRESSPPSLKRCCGIPKRGANTAILVCVSQNRTT
jgi:hypothetical protein